MTLEVGIVGVRGLSTLKGFKNLKETRVQALCDLNEKLLTEQTEKHGIPEKYRVYDDLLETDIDVVVIATPMHLHVPQVIKALEAGKHVLSEVTAGVTMEELWWLKKWVERYDDLVYMMAENYCYIPHNQIIKNMVKEGLFGDIYFGEGEYIHDIKELTTRANYDSSSDVNIKKGKTTWRRFWQLGRRGAFYPTHSIGPVMQWFSEDKIKSVSCQGTGWNTAPEFRQEDTSITTCKLETGKLIKIRIDCISERPHNLTYYSLQGTKGCYEAPRGLGDDHKIWLKGMDENTDKAEWRSLTEFHDYLPERYQKATKEQKAAGHWGGDYFIVEDFVKAITENQKPPIDVYDSCEWTAVGLLSEISVQHNGKPVLMPDFRGDTPVAEQKVEFVD